MTRRNCRKLSKKYRIICGTPQKIDYITGGPSQRKLWLFGPKSKPFERGIVELSVKLARKLYKLTSCHGNHGILSRVWANLEILHAWLLCCCSKGFKSWGGPDPKLGLPTFHELMLWCVLYKGCMRFVAKLEKKSLPGITTVFIV